MKRILRRSTMKGMAKKKKAKKSEKQIRNPNSPWIARLKALRAHYGLSQREAAAQISADLKTWRGWEQGWRMPSPMIERLLKLAFPEFFEKN